jgi:hypothetical protein
MVSVNYEISQLLIVDILRIWYRPTTNSAKLGIGQLQIRRNMVSVNYEIREIRYRPTTKSAKLGIGQLRNQRNMVSANYEFSQLLTVDILRIFVSANYNIGEMRYQW